MQHLLRKQIILFIACISIAMSALSQSDEVFQPNHDELPYYLGMSLGVSNSFMSFKRADKFLANTISTNADLFYPDNTRFLNLGLSGTLRLSKHILLRASPTLLISGNKSFKRKNSISLDSTYSTDAYYIELPFDIKMESDRYKAFRQPDIMRHYVLAGVKLGYDLAAGKTPLVNGLGSSNSNLIKGTDFSYEVGLGLSFFLRYATISPEIKFSYGINNLIKPASSTSSITLNNVDKLTSNFIYFTIFIEN